MIKRQFKISLSVVLALALTLNLITPALAWTSEKPDGYNDDYESAEIKEITSLDPADNAAAKAVRAAIASGDLDVTVGNRWTVCVYLCGSDLESDYGSSTLDIVEMLEAEIPDDVNVLLMTGGSPAWDPKGSGETYNKKIGEKVYLKPSAESTQIYAVDDERMTLLYDYKEQLNMGDAGTLAEFLEFALAYQPDVEHMMFAFWDHGGGPLDGAELDKNYSNAAKEANDKTAKTILSMREIASVFRAGKAARNDTPLDILAFDCCLMGSLEVASILRGMTDYLIVSEEIEPGSGHLYHWMSILKKRDATTLEICRRIVDLYPIPPSRDVNRTSSPDWVSAGDANWQNSKNLTLSVIDMSKVPALVDAVDTLAAALLDALNDEDNPERYAAVARAAETAPVMYKGTYGLLDLYSFASSLARQTDLGDISTRG